MNNKPSEKGIMSCNIRSLTKHYEDVKSYPDIKNADIICLQETWLDPEKVYGYCIKGMKATLNSTGKGKGIATYYTDDYIHQKSVTHPQYQMTLISGKTEDIINIYRSGGAPSNQLINDIKSLVNKTRRTIIVGDLNICSLKEKFHTVLRSLTFLGFKQKVSFPTHEGGGYIDHVHIYDPTGSEEMQPVKISHQSVYFTDHDIMFISSVSCSNNNICNSHVFCLQESAEQVVS